MAEVADYDCDGGVCGVRVGEGGGGLAGEGVEGKI